MKTSFASASYAFRNCVGQWLAASVLVCSCLSLAQAQSDLDPGAEEQAAKGPLTVENLIGNSVRVSDKDKYPEIEKAIQRFKNGDVEGAEDYLKQAAEKYPKLPPVDVIHAKMQLAARNAKNMRVLLERTTKENPDDPEAYLILADQAFVQGRITEALALFEMAAPLVEKFSGNSFRKNLFEIRVIAGRSAVAERRQQWEKSTELLKKWLQRDEESSAAYQRLGVAMFNMGESREALNNFRKARELDEKVGHPFVIMGRLFAQQKDKPNSKLNARKAFEKAYNEDKGDAKVAQAYAEFLIQDDKLTEAKKVASNLREKAPDSVPALMLDSIISMLQSDRSSAEEALKKVLQADPSHAAATNMLALLLIDSDSTSDRKRSLQYAQMNAQRFGSSSQANITLGWVLYQLGQKAEAQAALQKGLQAGNPSSNSAYLLARIMSEQEGQQEKAISALQQLLKNDKGLFLFRGEAQQLLDQLEADSE